MIKHERKKKYLLYFWFESIILSTVMEFKGKSDGLGGGIRVNCPNEGPGPARGESASVGIFLRDSSPYYASFGENHRKLRTARLTSTRGGLNLAPHIYHF